MTKQKKERHATSRAPKKTKEVAYAVKVFIRRAWDRKQIWYWVGVGKLFHITDWSARRLFDTRAAADYELSQWIVSPERWWRFNENVVDGRLVKVTRTHATPSQPARDRHG